TIALLLISSTRSVLVEGGSYGMKLVFRRAFSSSIWGSGAADKGPFYGPGPASWEKPRMPASLRWFCSNPRSAKLLLWLSVPANISIVEECLSSICVDEPVVFY
ncbi:hypothetical protein H0E87_007394, partial [Populus deltoides]